MTVKVEGGRAPAAESGVPADRRWIAALLLPGPDGPSGGLDALETHLRTPGLGDGMPRAVVFYAAPLRWIAIRLAEGAATGAAVADWTARAGRLLGLQRWDRAACLLVEAEEARHHPDKLARRLDGTGAPTEAPSDIGSSSVAGPPPGLYLSLAALALDRDPAARRTLAELEAARTALGPARDPVASARFHLDRIVAAQHRERDATRHELAQAYGRIAALEEEIAGLRRSRSYRLTAPLRQMGRALRGGAGS